MGTITRTVLFTDLANYTATVSRSDRQGLRRILSEHEELVAPIVSRYSGRVVKNLGDSFMCLFQAATDAVRAALDIQDFVMSGGAMSIRLALCTGDVEDIDGDAFGEAVNMASRILSKTPAGEIWFGAGTYYCMNASEIPWEGVGRFHLKGLPGEVEVFRAVPVHRAWLPDPVATAVKAGNLIRIRRGGPLPMLPPEPVILFEGFAPGSPALAAAVDQLPVLDPARLWLGTYNISPADRNAWTDAGRGLIIGTPEAIDAAIQEALKVVTRGSGSDTIVLDMGMNADLELMIAGLALPAVPLSEVVSSYFYDLLPDGRWVNRSERALLRVEVNPQGCTLHSSVPGITVDGRRITPGETVTLTGGNRIGTPVGDIEYVAVGEGYQGLLLGDTPMRLGVIADQSAEIGREPNHPGLALPDRRGQDNIRWCSGNRAARARSGGFTLDRALAGRRQAELRMIGEDVQLTPLHPRCPTYLLRQDAPDLDRIAEPASVRIGDLVIAGTTVVKLRRPDPS